MYYLGIDPGKNGGIAVLTENNVELLLPYSDEQLLSVCNSLTAEKGVCLLEMVHSMPKQGVRSTFALGQNYGYIRGVLESNNIPYQAVDPRRWKKEFGLNSDKAASIEVCRRLFPAADLHRTTRCKTEHDGMAEALLMAEYARRNF